MNPDCRDGKHASCSGNGWDYENDAICACPCNCHQIKISAATARFWGPLTISQKDTK